MFVLAVVAVLSPLPVHAAPPGEISLLQALSEWKFPGSNLLEGATMSDGGIPPLQAVKCAAIRTTPDPIEKVVAFYAERLGAGDPPGPPAEKCEAESVSVQDDSKGRPVTLRVFVVNQAHTSTTMVVSRAEGERETHIAWSHFIRLPAGDRRTSGRMTGRGSL